MGNIIKDENNLEEQTNNSLNDNQLADVSGSAELDFYIKTKQFKISHTTFQYHVYDPLVIVDPRTGLKKAIEFMLQG